MDPFEQLLKAIRARSHKRVSELIDQGVGINATDPKSPLCEAIISGSIPIVKLLLDNGAEVNVQSDSTAEANDQSDSVLTPLKCCVSSDSYQATSILELLLARGAEVNETDSSGVPLLHYAASVGSFDIVKHLIECGADEKQADSSGRSSLHHAAAEGSILVVEYLIEKGAVVNATDDECNTPLHNAMRWSRGDVVRLLLEKGADLTIENNNGENPRSYRRRFYPEFEDYSDSEELSPL